MAYESTMQGIRSLDTATQRRGRAAERKEKSDADWALEKRGMEKRLFEAQMEQMAGDAAEKQAKTKKMDAYGELSGMFADLEELDGLQGNELQKAAMASAAKYTDPAQKQTFLEAAQSGDYSMVGTMLSKAEGMLSSQYDDFDAPERVPTVTRSGKLLPLKKGSPMALRKASDVELEALRKISAKGGKWGDPEFYQEVHRIETGGYEPVKVVVDGQIREVPAHVAETNGLLTKEQADFNESADKGQRQRRDSHRKLGIGAETVRSKNTIAIDSIRKAKSVLENHSANKPVTGPESQYVPMNADLKMLEGHLRTVGGNIALETMSEMRKQSSSGATGFGALSKGELDLLLSTMGNIDPINNNDDSLWDQLDQIQKILSKGLEGYLPGETATQKDGSIIVFLGGDPTDIENWESY